MTFHTPRRFSLRAKRQAPEAELQKAVASLLRAYLPEGVWWTCSLSGVPLTAATAGQAKAAGMQRGAPDLSFVWPDGDTTYVELKSDKGVLTDEQTALAETLGDRFALCRTTQDVWHALTEWMTPYGLRFLTDTESFRRGAA